MDKEQTLCRLINQLFALEQKVKESNDSKAFQRKFERIWSTVTDLKLRIHNPIGEAYDLTRLDCEATVAGNSSEQLSIVEVIKPIIYDITDNQHRIVQRGVVIVEGK